MAEACIKASFLAMEQHRESWHAHMLENAQILDLLHQHAYVHMCLV